MKVAKVNIYIDSTCKSKLQEISKKNHVSISTVVAEMVIHFGNFIPLKDNLQKGYLVDQQKAMKTSIKPKYKFIAGDEFIQKRNMYISNLIYCFVYDKYKDYLPENLIQTAKRKYYSTLQKRKEEYYNYNTLLRNNVRMAKDKKFMAYMEKLNARQNQKANGGN